MDSMGQDIRDCGAARGTGRGLAERLGRDGGHIARLDVNAAELAVRPAAVRQRR